MKIGIQTWGTSGDIRPVITLAKSLAKKGHELTVMYTCVENVGSNYFDESSIEMKQVGAFDFKNKNLSGLWKLTAFEQVEFTFKNFFVPILENLKRGADILCETNDLVIGTPMQYPLAIKAQKQNIPFILLDFGYELLPYENCSDAIKEGINYMFLPLINKLRKDENMPLVVDVLAEVFKNRILHLVTVSKFFYKVNDGCENLYRVTGFIDVSKQFKDWKMPNELETILKSDKKVVLFTIGGCIEFEENLNDIFSIFVEVVEQLGIQGVVQTRPDKLDSIPNHPRIYKLGSAPHKAIIPFCSAVVHHASAGMTYTVTSCGCPSVTIEYAFDQSFWGRELSKLGVGSELLSRRGLSVNGLLESLGKVLKDRHMKKRAKLLSNQMENENGVYKAVEAIEEVMNKEFV